VKVYSTVTEDKGGKLQKKNSFFMNKKDKNVTLFGEAMINLSSIEVTSKDDWIPLYQEQTRESSVPVGSVHIQIMNLDPNVKGKYQERMKETTWHNLSEVTSFDGMYIDGISCFYPQALQQFQI
jgi:hypothetical protein